MKQLNVSAWKVLESAKKKDRVIRHLKKEGVFLFHHATKGFVYSLDVGQFQATPISIVVSLLDGVVTVLEAYSGVTADELKLCLVEEKTA